MNSIFPFYTETGASSAGSSLPPAKEVARDPKTGKTIWRGGSPVIVTGLEAVAAWAIAALRTARCRHGIYSDRFGCEADRLIGCGYSEAVKTAEAPRMVRDALKACPYIRNVEDLAVDFQDGKLAISGRLRTIYGEVRLDVSDI